MKLRYAVFSLIEKSREVLSVRNKIPSDRFGKASRTFRKIPFLEESYVNRFQKVGYKPHVILILEGSL